MGPYIVWYMVVVHEESASKAKQKVYGPWYMVYIYMIWYTNVRILHGIGYWNSTGILPALDFGSRIVFMSSLGPYSSSDEAQEWNPASSNRDSVAAYRGSLRPAALH